MTDLTSTGINRLASAYCMNWAQQREGTSYSESAMSSYARDAANYWYEGRKDSERQTIAAAVIVKIKELRGWTW